MNVRLFLVTLFSIVAVAYLVSTNGRFMDFLFYIRQGNFWFLWGLTTVLFWQYTRWITEIGWGVYAVLPAERETKKSHLHVYYYVLTLFVVIVFNLLLLTYMYRLAGTSIWDVGYFRFAFPLFFFFVLGYVMMVQQKPHWSIYYNVRANWFWKVVRRVVNKRDRKEVHPEPIASKFEVKIFDILIFKSHKNGGILYLITGETIVLKGNSTVIEQWLAKCWFLKIGKDTHVNMFHLRRSVSSKYVLEPESEVKDLFREKMNLTEDELKKLLKVSEWFKESLAQHEKIRQDLPRDCWDEYYVYQ